MQQFVSHLKVKSVVYEYNKPQCIDQFFDSPPAVVGNGRTSAQGFSIFTSVWINALHLRKLEFRLS